MQMLTNASRLLAARLENVRRHPRHSDKTLFAEA